MDPASVIVRGYASVSGNVFFKMDQYGDRIFFTIDPGAFSAVLGRLDGAPLPMNFAHALDNLSPPNHLQFGQSTQLTEDATGLYFEAEPFATQEGIDTVTVMAGVGRIGASFSFDPGETTVEPNGLIRIHSFSELHEFGPATFGANPAAYAELAPRAAAGEQAEPNTEPAAASDDASQDVEGAALSLALYRASNVFARSRS